MTDTPPAGVLTRGWVATLLKHGLVTSLACWGLWVQMAYRVPSQILFVLLPWVGVTTTVLSFVLLANHVLDVIAAEGPMRHAVRRLEWWVGLAVRAFIYYSLLLYANGKLDRSPTTDRPSEVRAVTAVRAPLGGVTPYGWLTVRSWENPAKTIRVLLRPDERGAFWVDEAVVVELRPGALRIPWVARIVEDRERRNRAILEVAPRAAMAWQDLVRFNLDRGRWAQAVEAAHQYFAIYPGDREFVLEVADRFDMAEQPAHELEVLDPFMHQVSPDAMLFLSCPMVWRSAGPAGRRRRSSGCASPRSWRRRASGPTTTWGTRSATSARWPRRSRRTTGRRRLSPASLRSRPSSPCSGRPYRRTRASRLHRRRGRVAADSRWTSGHAGLALQEAREAMPSAA